ncbi:hypothetical protein Ami103574_15215 [Aminipila butyrica]|uniref:Uncharacterized protein n=1 Tax=Aminipila butyrica TaxID=433296 RepID=A0A858BZ97_9FIRM|nr:hypothetical protein [Aminipila butyrica]QIB70559.1 hypothetical protein Ami103574_15215 [Aminipila butyrica]
MKVRCIDTKRLDGEGQYQSLKVGMEYTVLAIEFYDKSESSFSESIGDFILYRIKDNDGIVIPFPAKLFEITSEELSACWVVNKEKDGSYSILPKLWSRLGFWEDYYNDEDTAIDEFEKAEREMLLQE